MRCYIADMNADSTQMKSLGYAPSFKENKKRRLFIVFILFFVCIYHLSFLLIPLLPSFHASVPCQLLLLLSCLSLLNVHLLSRHSLLSFAL